MGAETRPRAWVDLTADLGAFRPFPIILTLSTLRKNHINPTVAILSRYKSGCCDQADLGSIPAPLFLVMIYILSIRAATRKPVSAPNIGYPWNRRKRQKMHQLSRLTCSPRGDVCPRANMSKQGIAGNCRKYQISRLRRTDRPTARLTDRPTDRPKDRQARRQARRQAHRQAHSQAHRQAHRQAQRQTGSPTGSHTGAQPGSQTDSQTGCLEADWKQSGSCLAATWKLPGSCLEAAWKMLRSCLEAAWNLPGSYLEAAWTLGSKV